MTRVSKRIRGTVSGLMFANVDTQLAYQMGRDCAINGPNVINCNFSIFSTPENTKEWERGKRDAEQTE